MYQINFESRSPYRYIAYFRSPKCLALDYFNSYFSVEVEVAQSQWGTLLDSGIRYTIKTKLKRIGLPLRKELIALISGNGSRKRLVIQSIHYSLTIKKFLGKDMLCAKTVRMKFARIAA